ncbi:unnamed protein product [Rotaria sordida]|uniref:Uncharacterized protein n=1 Tax=Rotaria sordida TaxID=392033 RepID=A0A818UIV8_9BILA|nr:unnamed protein product [Rotaria sordida]
MSNEETEKNVALDKYVLRGEFEAQRDGLLTIVIDNQGNSARTIWFQIRSSRLSICHLFYGIFHIVYQQDYPQLVDTINSNALNQLLKRVFSFIDHLLNGTISLRQMTALKAIFCNKNINVREEVKKLFANCSMQVVTNIQQTTTVTNIDIRNDQEIGRTCQWLQIYQYYSHINAIIECIEKFDILSIDGDKKSIVNLKRLSNDENCSLKEITKVYEVLYQHFHNLGSTHLELIKATLEYSTVIHMMKDFNLYSSDGRRRFQELRDNLTTQFQLQERNNMILNSLIITYALCEPFIFKAKNLEEFVSRLAALSNFEENSLKHMKVVNDNIKLVKLWLSTDETTVLDNALITMEHLYKTGIVKIHLGRLMNEQSYFEIEYSIDRIQTQTKRLNNQKNGENINEDEDERELEKIKFVLSMTDVADHKRQLTFCNTDLQQNMFHTKLLLNEQLELLEIVEKIYLNFVKLEMVGHPRYQLKEQIYEIHDKTGEIKRMLVELKSDQPVSENQLKSAIKTEINNLRSICLTLEAAYVMWIESSKRCRHENRLLKLFSNRQIMIMIILLTTSTIQNEIKNRFLNQLCQMKNISNKIEEEQNKMIVRYLTHYLRSLRIANCDLSEDNISHLYTMYKLEQDADIDKCLTKLGQFLQKLFNDEKPTFQDNLMNSENQQYLVTLNSIERIMDKTPSLEHDLDMETCCVLLNIFNDRLPCFHQILWCSIATEDDIRLFFSRIRAFCSLIFIVMDVDKMHHRLRELLLNEQDSLTRSQEPHGPVYYFSRELACRKETDSLTVENSIEVFHEYLSSTKTKPLFYRLLLHPGVTEEQIEEFMSSICQLAEKLTDIELVVFFDEVNTSSCLGLFKEMFIDRTLHGVKLPKNIFFTAAINPSITPLPHNSRVHRSDYLVHRLPQSLENLKVCYDILKSQTLEDYIQQKIAMFRVDSFSNNSEAQMPLEKYVQEMLTKSILKAQEFCENRIGRNSVSQREIQRCFNLIGFFWNMRYDDEIDDHEIQYQSRAKQSIALALALTYYFRLPTAEDNLQRNDTQTPTREELGQLLSGFIPEFPDMIENELERFVNKDNFVFPDGVAINQAVREHIFSIVVSIATRTPLCIIGAPGQSKTLSFQIVLQNLQGLQLSTKTFCKRLPAIDPFFCLGSKYTRAEDIAHVFERAIRREQQYMQNGMNIRCVVFLDEASLPDERKMVLKVLHPYLDECNVAFVAVANKAFDAANANRMICVYRSLPSDNDQKILAYGCLGLQFKHEEHTVNKRLEDIIYGLCQGYRRVITSNRIPHIFHDRDFIYMLRELRFELPTISSDQDTKIDGITPTSLLHALEDNFNGIKNDEFKELVEIFFTAIQEQCPDFQLPSKTEQIYRNVPIILRQSMKLDPAHRRLYGRYKLIIDESDDESAIRLLFQTGILDSDPSRTTVFRMSDFADDIHSEIRNVEILSTIKLCMETGKTILMVNTGRIHGSLYDVFNQNFSIMATDETRKIFSKVAIGSKTVDVVVHEEFQCIVHVPRSEFKDLPPPFLSRFQKYSWSISDFYRIQFEHLTLVSPESIILKLPTFEDQIAQWLCTDYFQHQEHFSIERFIQQLIADPSIDVHHDDLLATTDMIPQKHNNITLITKVMIFTRTSSYIIGLNKESKSQLFNGGDNDEYGNISDNIDVLNMAMIENSVELQGKFHAYEQDDRKNVLIVVIDAQNGQQRLHIPFVRQLIDKTEYTSNIINLKQRKYFLMLIHSPAQELYHQSYFPSIFLHNWDYYFFDTCIPGSAFHLQKMIQILSSSYHQQSKESIDNILCDLNTLFDDCLWDFCSRIQITLQELSDDMFKNKMVSRFYKNQTSPINRVQCLKKILHESTELQKCIVNIYHEYMSTKNSFHKIYNMIYQFSKDILCGKRFDGLVNSIQSQTRITFSNFVSHIFKFIMNNYGLETLSNMSTDNNSYSSMLKLIDYSSFVDDNNVDDQSSSTNHGIIQIVTNYSCIPQTFLYHLFHQRIKSIADEIKLTWILKHAEHQETKDDSHRHFYLAHQVTTTTNNLIDENETTEFTSHQFRDGLAKSLMKDKVLIDIVTKHIVESYSNDLIRTFCLMVEKNFTYDLDKNMKTIEFVSRWLQLKDEYDYESFNVFPNKHIWLLAHVYTTFEYDQNDLLSLYSAFRITDHLQKTSSSIIDLSQENDVTRSQVRENLFTLMFDYLWNNLYQLCSNNDNSEQWIHIYSFISKYYPSNKVLGQQPTHIKNQIEFMNLAYLIFLNDKIPEPKKLLSHLLNDTNLIDSNFKQLPTIIQYVNEYFTNQNINSSALMIDLQQWIISILKASKKSCKQEINYLLNYLNQSTCQLTLTMKQFLFDELAKLSLEYTQKKHSVSDKPKFDYCDRIVVLLPIVIECISDEDLPQDYQLLYHPSIVSNNNNELKRQPLLDLLFFHIKRFCNDVTNSGKLVHKTICLDQPAIKGKHHISVGQNIFTQLKNYFLLRSIALLLCETDLDEYSQDIINDVMPKVIKNYLSINQEDDKLNNHLQLFVSTIISKYSWNFLLNLLKSDRIQILDSQWATSLSNILELKQISQTNNYLQLCHKIQFTISPYNDISSIFPDLHQSYDELSIIFDRCIKDDIQEQRWITLSDWIQCKLNIDEQSNLKRNEIKAMILLKIYYDYYCNNQLALVDTLLDIIENMLELSSDELRIFRAILKPEQFMIGYPNNNNNNNNEDSNFLNSLFKLDYKVDDEVWKLSIRHLLVNLMAMILMEGQQSFLWTFAFQPLTLEHTFG